MELLQKAYFDARKQADFEVTEFAESVSKFSKHTKFNVRATIEHGDLMRETIVSCIDFDRDDAFFATGGVTMAIKVFNYNNVVNTWDDGMQRHHAVREIRCDNKLSCLRFSPQTQQHLAAADYGGAVKVWDISREDAAPLASFEHAKRAWCVDYSPQNPSLLASGCDDGYVNVWRLGMGEKSAVFSIKNRANVCSVAFNPDAGHYLAAGTADHHVQLFDLRNATKPVSVLRAHKKAISYVKFMNGRELVSASTDGTLRLWNVQNASTPSSVRTFRGHTNAKNFVGLAVNKDYIACGSENNSVFTYAKSMSMPALTHRLESRNPFTGAVLDDTNHFVSNVCFQRNANVLVAANSQGTLQVLEMAR